MFHHLEICLKVCKMTHFFINSDKHLCLNTVRKSYFNKNWYIFVFWSSLAAVEFFSHVYLLPMLLTWNIDQSFEMCQSPRDKRITAKTLYTNICTFICMRHLYHGATFGMFRIQVHANSTQKWSKQTSPYLCANW